MKTRMVRLVAASGLSVIAFLAGVWFSHASTHLHSHSTGRRVGAEPMAVARKAPTEHKRKILYWWDPMVGPSSISSKPGISSMGMKLIPVYASAGGMRRGGVVINPIIRQDMGVETATAVLAPLRERIRTVGYVRAATPRTTRFVLRVNGYVKRLYVATDGQSVARGQKLLSVYSPELVAAESEMLDAYRAWRTARKAGERSSSAAELHLFHALVHRLINMGVSSDEIRKVVGNGRVMKYVTFFSDQAGVAERIGLRHGASVHEGETVMEIKALAKVWLDAHVYNRQLTWVKLGDKMRFDLDSQPGYPLYTKVDFIAPTVNPISHTVVVRGELANTNGRLRPGMIGVVYLTTQIHRKAILIPRDAVIESGTRNVVFIAEGHGHYYPVRVRLGLRAEHGMVEILKGIGPGQRVVSNGEFLIDVESQLRSALPEFTPETPPTKGKHPADSMSAGGSSR